MRCVSFMSSFCLVAKKKIKYNVCISGVFSMPFIRCCMTVWRLIPQMMIKSTNVKIFKNE